MMINPISAVSVDALNGLRSSAAERARAAQSAAADQAGAAGFGPAITGALDNLGDAQQRSAEAARAAATGDLQSVSEYMVAASEAQLATQITAAVRNRAIDAFNEIMRMQV